MTTSTKRPDDDADDMLDTIEQLIRAGKDDCLTSKEIIGNVTVALRIPCAPTNESPAPQAAATPPTIGGKTAFERIHDRIADYLKSSDPATGITGFIFERFINVPPPIATQPAPQPPVEGLRETVSRIIEPSIFDHDGAGSMIEFMGQARRQTALEKADAILTALASPPLTAGAEWRHKKRGTTYTEIGRAKLQKSPSRFVYEDDVMVIYRGGDGRLWVREASEFEDGRFERVTAPTTLTEQPSEAPPSPTAVVSKSKISNFDTAKATVRREMRDIHAFVGFPDGSPEAPPSAPDVREALELAWHYCDPQNMPSDAVRFIETTLLSALSQQPVADREAIAREFIAIMQRHLRIDRNDGGYIVGWSEAAAALLSALPAKGER